MVEDLELRGKKLGRVEIEAVNRGVAPAEGGVREWRLNKFNVILPEAVRDGRLRPGMKVAMAAFGSGFTWGAAIIDW